MAKEIDDSGSCTIEIPMSLILKLDQPEEEEAVQLGCLIAERIANEADIPVHPAGFFVDVEQAETYDPKESNWDIADLFFTADD